MRQLFKTGVLQLFLLHSFIAGVYEATVAVVV